MYGAKWSKKNNSIVDLNKDDPTGSPMPTIEMKVEEFNPTDGDSEAYDGNLS